ncbi:helix-hairpin-helix domain-containing protein [Haliangium ochraceum]|uniref:DNA polymerase domain-containing protein n=1 Tax=Haliangium ochraceum (strain DSM 14365 / JCM 11303 / SMP-2) TaxID=502025 RepID=D0LVD8_HALO1|nr:helix-hairpin-helix domain-containing protein [Haliangium ochraceum]ACY17499.1 DNA polymerase domain-containing protein [Haliangium ochraceum DSM 14365]
MSTSPKPPTNAPTNAWIGEQLERVANLLEAQSANPYRVRAYRRGAELVRGLKREIAALFPASESDESAQNRPYEPHNSESADAAEAQRDDDAAAEGRAWLEQIPGIGPGLSAALEEMARTGRLRLLERLEGELSPEATLAQVPGIGDELAHRIHEVLGIVTLEDLEAAAHDGRLEAVDGIGEGRVHSVIDHLAAALDRHRDDPGERAQQRPAPGGEGNGDDSEHRGVVVHADDDSAHAESDTEEAAGEGNQLPLDWSARARVPAPPVTMLLALDAAYRRLADDDRLPRIAPKRFNPDAEAWLPIWHTERDDWSFTVLFSNTARAHQLGKTHDWVVIFYEYQGREGQCTVVTEHRGRWTGERVVRGRERACAALRERQGVAPEVRRWAHSLAESA